MEHFQENEFSYTNLEFDNRPFEIYDPLWFILWINHSTILELDSNFTDFFHEFRECIVYRERNEIRNGREKKKEEKEEEGRKKEERENSKIDVIVHARYSLEVDVSLSTSTRFAYTWFAQRISLEPEKRGSVPWLADPVLTQKCTQHFPRKFLIICPELPLSNDSTSKLQTFRTKISYIVPSRSTGNKGGGKL